MAVNKVIYNDTTLIDLTEDTVTAETLEEGETAHDASGEVITGTLPKVIKKLTTQTVAIADLEGGVYLWDYAGEKTLDYSYSYETETTTIYQNPVVLQISECDNFKTFYLIDDDGAQSGFLSHKLLYGSVDKTVDWGYCLTKKLVNLPEFLITEKNIIPTLTTQTVAIADLEGGVYLWNCEGEKTLNWYSGTEIIYQNPVLLQVAQNGTQKDFYLFDNAGSYDEASNRLIYGSVDVEGNDDGMCYVKSLANIPDVGADQLVDLNSTQTISGDKAFDGETTFGGNVDFSNATVTGLSGGLTKTKITLAQLRERLADYTNHRDEIVQVVHTGSNSLSAAILGRVGLITINASTISNTVSSTSVSQSAIYGVNNTIYISSSNAYVNRSSWDFDIANQVINTTSGTKYTITDADYEFYVIGG